MSDAVTGIVISASLAAVGYVVKEIVQGVRGWRLDRERRRARLHQLRVLLQASRVAFVVQCARRDRLADRLRTRFADQLPASGYERLFAQFYDQFDAEDRDLHSVVRAYTEHALRPINQSMLAWLREDSEHRVTRGKTGDRARLAAGLNELDAHLLLWLAKYEGWIPGRPDHALVYLADEEEHGLRFPRGLEDTLDKALAEL